MASRQSASASMMLGNFFHLHDFAQGAQGAVLNYAHRSHALAENLGDFLVVQLLDEAQDDDLSLIVAEAKDGLTDSFLLGLAFGRGLGVAW